MTKSGTNASGAIWWPNSEVIQVAPSGDQIWNYCMWRHPVTKFWTNVSVTILWPNFELMQVALSGDLYVHCTIILTIIWVRCAYGNVSWIGCKFGHQMAPLELVLCLVTRSRHLHYFQIWSPDRVICISSTFGLQMAQLAIVQNLVSRLRHLH